MMSKLLFVILNEILCLCIFLISLGGTAGAQTVTLTGQGFSDDVEATIYGN